MRPHQSFHHNEPRVRALQGGARDWWDAAEDRRIRATTLYLAQGCPDWGEKARPPYNLCTFCALPHAARAYRDEFFGGRALTPEEHLGIFRANLEHLAPEGGDVHTAMVFNAGSFLTPLSNPPEVQEGVAHMVADHPTIVRLVVESRAELIGPDSLRRLTSILKPAGKHLTIRIGVETQDDRLRMKVLRKGHSRGQLFAAVEAMRQEGVLAGAYTLLNPAPGLDEQWAMEEADRTIDWVLGELGMQEAYFGPACVAPGTPLEAEWRSGRFRPANLWATWRVLRRAAARYGRRVHLLPFVDEPPFLAVPSNHVSEGIPESLEGAEGCDLEFHGRLRRYRASMKAAVLQDPPQCACRPEWAV